MNEYEDHFITTYTGKKFHYLDPRPEEIDIKDIAHALSLTCRFGGQCREFYSVAEHSVRVANLSVLDDALLALMHDAAEAYLPDVPSPIKRDSSHFIELEDKILDAIFTKFEIQDEVESALRVKYLDSMLLGIEARELMPHMDDWSELSEPTTEGPRWLLKIGNPWTPRAAEREFLWLFQELTKEDRYWTRKQMSSPISTLLPGI